MSTPDNTTNYPDILGAITKGARFNLDVVQFALAARPPQVAAGQTCELILLAQNASDADVDVILQVELPERDQAKQKNTFTASSAKLRIGLRPAEVGFVSLPVTVAPTTHPAPGYMAGLDLEIKHMSKQTPQRIRTAAGGGAVQAQDLPEETINHMRALRALVFSVDPGKKKKYLQTTFTVLPPAIAGLAAPRANWVSLWTMSNLSDPYTIARQVAEPAQACLRQMKRETVFMPLLKATQDRFGTSGYALLPPEAIFITKQLTLVLEAGVIEPSPGNMRPAWPRWYIKMCRLLAQGTALSGEVELMVTRQLYDDLIYDAIMAGFKTLGDVTQEDFGSHDETSHYAEGIVGSLEKNQPLDIARAYLPLVMAGIVVNTRVTMPREQVRDSVFMLSKALEKRRLEKDEANAFVFEITDKLIEQALDMS